MIRHGVATSWYFLRKRSLTPAFSEHQVPTQYRQTVGQESSSLPWLRNSAEMHCHCISMLAFDLRLVVSCFFARWVLVSSVPIRGNPHSYLKRKDFAKVKKVEAELGDWYVTVTVSLDCWQKIFKHCRPVLRHPEVFHENTTEKLARFNIILLTLRRTALLSLLSQEREMTSEVLGAYTRIWRQINLHVVFWRSRHQKGVFRWRHFP